MIGLIFFREQRCITHRTIEFDRMRLRVIIVAVFLIGMTCILAVDCEDEVLTRTSRTISFGSWRPRWLESFVKGWPIPRILEWPRISAASLFQLIASPNTAKMVFVFKPEDGLRASYVYQQRFGYRGERLIEWLGTGLMQRSSPYRLPTLPPGLTPPLPPL